MEELLVYVSVLAPIVFGLVEVAKRTFALDDNLIPLLALVIGIVAGIAAAPFVDLDIYSRAWAGALSGLTAVGLFEGGKAAFGPSKY